MKALGVILAGSLLLAGCAMGGGEGGVADYGALQRAQADCKAKGGKLVLKSGDPTWIGNYACERT
jgi:hypothetical protein